MRRSICSCEPTFAISGERNTWKFIFTTSVALPKGTHLRFDLQSKGRSIDWEIPSSNPKATGNVIYAQLDKGKVIFPKEADVPGSIVPQYEFTLPSNVPAGSDILFFIGAPPGSPAANRKKNGTQAQCCSQRRKAFHLYVDTSGKGRYDEPEVFSMDVRGGPLKTIKVLTPSFVTKNKRFDIVVRFEDEFGNLTNNAAEDTLIELSYENIRENLNWKLFVPETGFITLPNLYFNEPGVYTINLKNTKTKEIFRAAPIKCFPDNNKHLFWGLLHGESERYDSTENIESCLRHFRDEKALNFYGVSPFESQEETSNDTWKQIVQNVIEFDESDRFITFIGVQWAGVKGEEGVRQIVFGKENKQILRKKDPKYNSLQKIYKSFSPKEIISIPTFTMGSGFEFDFKAFDPQYERVVEIYNAWGSSECTKDEGNPKPIKTEGKNGIKESAVGSIQKALAKNCRFGFVAGGLDDRGIYSELFEGDQVQYTPGMTGIVSQEHTRGALIEALYNRSCYATTGERIIVGLNLAGSPMGSEINTADKPGLVINRHLSGYVAGTTKLRKVEIIRNGKVLKTYKPDGYSFDFEYDDMEPLAKVTMPGGDKKPPFVYYYIRVEQEDDHMAWSSPIWVDLVPTVPGKGAVKKALTKPVKPIETFEDFDEEEEDEDEDNYDDYSDLDEDSED